MPFVFNVDDREFEPTDWALQQFSIRAAVPSSTVISKLREQDDYDSEDAEVMAMLANNALRSGMVYTPIRGIPSVNFCLIE